MFWDLEGTYPVRDTFKSTCVDEGQLMDGTDVKKVLWPKMCWWSQGEEFLALATHVYDLKLVAPMKEVQHVLHGDFTCCINVPIEESCETTERHRIPFQVDLL
jgi:hypothetical protein